eukprot:TRINITY_DN29343_c0_g2_i1.p1 TRINITY_DN29343_c0_g2~~TRINITY_DN29343_c0_g2_i1.p1  ORF type:complete len:363 (-),score=47.67 TRINITY_DN29343_c0_g2_i1:27-1079(-)
MEPFTDSSLVAAVAAALLVICVAVLLVASVVLPSAKLKSHVNDGGHRLAKARDRRCQMSPKTSIPWIERLKVSEAEVNHIRSFSQRSSTGRASREWLQARKHRLTASRFCLAASSVLEEQESLLGKYGDAESCCVKLIVAMLTQPEAKTSPRRFGVANESSARQAYIGFRLRGRTACARERFSVEETGLCIWRDEPWLAASPDGVVWDGDDVGALEIKCSRSPTRMHSVENVAPEYYDQMQGEMAILSSVLGRKVAWCDFFSWSPSRCRCRRVTFDADHFYTRILPKLRAFYFGAYVPVARSVSVGALCGSAESGVSRLAREQLKSLRKSGISLFQAADRELARGTFEQK